MSLRVKDVHDCIALITDTLFDGLQEKDKATSAELTLKLSQAIASTRQNLAKSLTQSGLKRKASFKLGEDAAANLNRAGAELKGLQKEVRGGVRKSGEKPGGGAKL